MIKKKPAIASQKAGQMKSKSSSYRELNVCLREEYRNKSEAVLNCRHWEVRLKDREVMQDLSEEILKKKTSWDKWNDVCV